MTKGPGDDVAAGCGNLRASHADRERVIATTAVVYFAFWLIGSFIMLANAEW
jgi:hypothetical protein